MTLVTRPPCRTHGDQEIKGCPKAFLQVDVIGQVSGPTSPARAPNRPEQSHTADELKDMGKWGHHSLQVMRMTNPETYMMAHQAPTMYLVTHTVRTIVPRTQNDGQTVGASRCRSPRTEEDKETRPMNEHQSKGNLNIPIPRAIESFPAVERDGKEWLSVTHVCQTLGLDPKSQRRKLQNRSWTTAVMMTLQVGNQKRRLYMVDGATLRMWLANIHTSRVKPEAKESLEAYQEEIAEVLDAYFFKGRVINPRVSEEQLDNLSDANSVYQQQLELLTMAEGLVDPSYLEAKTRALQDKKKALEN